jgi:hypothetical protein
MIDDNNSLAFDTCGDILVLSQVQWFQDMAIPQGGCGRVLKGRDLIKQGACRQTENF